MMPAAESQHVPATVPWCGPDLSAEIDRAKMPTRGRVAKHLDRMLTQRRRGAKFKTEKTRAALGLRS